MKKQAVPILEIIKAMGLPQDYARPNEPCTCGHDAWYQRKASLAGGWACGHCHPSYEMIMEQRRENYHGKRQTPRFH